MIGILGASKYEGVLDSLNERTVIATRYGEVSVALGEVSGKAAAYVRRFGWEDNIASNVANHAAHALAFKALGVTRAITLNGFGAVNPKFQVGDLVVYHDYIGMCDREPATIFAGEPLWPRANMIDPFCPEIRQALVSGAKGGGRPVHSQAVNICVQGPHNETPAEIEAFRRWGADIVCTTIYPEVVYFRELEICFAGLCWVSDMAGVEDSRDWKMIELEELQAILSGAVGSISEHSACRCPRTWDGIENLLPDWYLKLR